MLRRSLPRRALLGATLGALYAFLLLPSPGPDFLGLNLLGVAWFLLSISLLFLRPLAYHAFTTWVIVWVAWKGVEAWRSGVFNLAAVVLDIVVPVVSVALLTSSPYLELARRAQEPEGPEGAETG